MNRTTIKIGPANYVVELNGSVALVNDVSLPSPEFALEDRLVRVFGDNSVQEFVVNRVGDDLWLLYDGREYPLAIETERDRLLRLAADQSDGKLRGAVIKAAMPGLVVRVLTTVGKQVTRGESLLILEAMKMENEIRSPADGVVKQIVAAEHDSVEKGDTLLILE